MKYWQTVQLTGAEPVEVKLQGRIFVCVIPEGGVDSLGLSVTYAEMERSGVEAVFAELSAWPQFKLSKALVKILCAREYKEKFSQLMSQMPFEFRVVECARDLHFQFFPSVSKLRLAVASKANAEVVSKKLKSRVLIVDDSPTIQKLLRMIVESDPTLEVAGVTGKPLEVKKLIEQLKPDVMTLDIHMPDLTGVELLKTLPREILPPTIVITSLTKEEGPLVLEALENGALDYIHKPSLDQIDRVTGVIVERIKALGSIRRVKPKSKTPAPRTIARVESDTDMNRVVAIGSSTGGTEALRVLLTSLPAEIPPMVVVQHIPAIFSAALAQRLNTLCNFEVKEAVDGDLVVKNRVLIAPGGFQMKLVPNSAGQYQVRVEKSGAVNLHQPSVDVLFQSVAEHVGRSAVGVILTGMGADGAKGMKMMFDRGSRTVAQNEETCVVFGMPKEAIRLGGAEFVEPLEAIAARIYSLLREPKNKLKRGA